MLMEIVVGLGALLLGGYVYMRITHRREFQMTKDIPGPSGFELASLVVRTAFKNHFELFEIALSVTGKYKDIAKIQLGPKFLFGLYNPKDIELVLGSNAHLKKSSEYKYFEPWFGNGLLISAGDTWSAHRKMIAPTFHLNVLKRFMAQFNIRGRALVQKMAQEKGKEFDCHHYMSECTVETLVETVMGAEKCFAGNNKTCYNYAMAVMDMCDILHLRHTRLWLRSDSLFNNLDVSKKQRQLLDLIHKFTNKVFTVKKESVEKNKSEDTAEVSTNLEPLSTEDNQQLQEEKYSFGRSTGLKDDIDDNTIGEKKRSPFLETLIERSMNQEDISEQEVINQVNTIMFEGHDTTAAGSSFFLCVMAALPEIQAKCQEELDGIFGESDRDVTFNDTLQMKYLERCLLETLRLFPPVPVISRELAHDVQLNSDKRCTMPKGSTVGLLFFALHRRSDVYPDPLVFDPDNFLPERSANRHFYSFVPFSAGPRSCVGRKYAMLKLKILLAHILRNYTVTGGQPINEWKLQADIILKRGDGFNIKLVPRKHNRGAEQQLIK